MTRNTKEYGKLYFIVVEGRRLLLAPDIQSINQAKAYVGQPAFRARFSNYDAVTFGFRQWSDDAKGFVYHPEGN